MEKITIAEIDWPNAHYMCNGEWCCVFDLGNDCVAKVGIHITADEAEAQQYVYERHNKALPVLGHKEQVWLPSPIRTLYCPLHGPFASESRRELLLDLLDAQCTCEMALDVLCMPKANPNINRYRDDWEIRQFIKTVDSICEKELQRWWDPAPRNVAHWRRHLVALDFTDRFYDGPSYSVSWKFRE